MPQHKHMKKVAPKFTKQKQTVARIAKVNSRKARKDGMVMRKNKLSDNSRMKAKLQSAITKNIEDELSSRAGASSTCNLKIIKPPSASKDKKK